MSSLCPLRVLAPLVRFESQGDKSQEWTEEQRASPVSYEIQHAGVGSSAWPKPTKFPSFAADCATGCWFRQTVIRTLDETLLSTLLGAEEVLWPPLSVEFLLVLVHDAK